jgi:D-glycero-alpha-D-manno-heptose-7-phosphate kinase
MITVQSPLRVSFFGGGTDFPSYFLQEGGCVLSMTIDKYIFVTAKERFDQKIRVGYTKTELVDRLDDVKHDLIREALRSTGIHDSVEISTMGDIPSSGSGLGSSSTVTVGALQALYALRGEVVTPDRLASEACKIEIDILRKPIGIQDQYIAAFGGFRFMEFKTSGDVTIERVSVDPYLLRKLSENFLLFFTGHTRRSETILEEQKSNIKNRLPILEEMKRLAYLARDELERGNIDEIGHMLHYSWSLKKRLASRISNDEIDAIYSIARKAGALGGKLTGAGGGGFLLLYCPKEKQDTVREAMQSLHEVPFTHEPDGAKVIFNYSRNGITMAAKKEPPDQVSYHYLPALKREQLTVPKNYGGLMTNPNRTVGEYLHGLHQTIVKLPFQQIYDVVKVLHQKRRSGATIFVLGNGGSASTATHFVCDLAKNTRVQDVVDFKVVGLADNMAIFSAYANDEGYESVFKGQLASLVNKGDVVIGISGSGNSMNVIEAIEFAKSAGALTIGMTGFDGGKLGKITDIQLHVPSTNIDQVEDTHLILEHIITRLTREIAAKETNLAREAHAERLGEPLIPSAVDLPRDTAERAELILSPSERVNLLYGFNRDLLGMKARDVLEGLLVFALKYLSASSGSVFRLNERGNPADAKILFNGDVQELEQSAAAELFDHGLAGWVYEHLSPALVENTLDDPRWLKRDWDIRQGVSRSAIAVPITQNGKVQGILTLVQSDEKRFRNIDVEMLSAAVLAVSMHNVFEEVAPTP